MGIDNEAVVFFGTPIELAIATKDPWDDIDALNGKLKSDNVECVYWSPYYDADLEDCTLCLIYGKVEESSYSPKLLSMDIDESAAKAKLEEVLKREKRVLKSSAQIGWHVSVNIY